MTTCIFHGPDGLLKWRRNSVQNANAFYYLSVLKTKKSQLTKCCIKCLDSHKKLRQQSKCKHVRGRSRCLFCGGSQICEYNKIKQYCLFYGGGEICERSRKRSICKGCGGGQICEHNLERSKWLVCDPPGHLAGLVQNCVYTALKNNKEIGSTEYLGCNIKTFKQHIEQQFTEGMS